MLNKKYFVLIVVLLVGVVLLSGCINGDDLSNGDDETEEVIENAEKEQIINETFTALENQDESTFNSLVSDETTYFFKGELLNNKSSKTISSQEIYSDLLTYYKDRTISDIQISDLNIENNSATAIVKVITDKYEETLPIQINLEKSGENLIITKFGFIDKIQIDDERNTIQKSFEALNNTNKDDFIDALNSQTTFYENGDQDTDIIANNPSTFYDEMKTEIEKMELTYEYYNIIFNSSDSHKIMLDVEEINSSTDYGFEFYFGYDEDKTIPVDKIIYYTDISYTE